MARCLETAHDDISGESRRCLRPPLDPHREQLRRLRAGLTLTAVAIRGGAAAVIDSVKLLNQLDGRAVVQSDGKADGAP
jgi:hypothetical protein